MISSPRKPTRRKIVLGKREIIAHGLKNNFWSDLFHHGMHASWPQFLAGALVAFLSVNLLFAGLYALGSDPIANMPAGSFAHYFYFSVETLATIGYGDMHPQTHYGHILATVEALTALIFSATIIGLVYSRFSRPSARMIFVENPVISQHEGYPTLTFRVANARLNAIGDATAKLWMIRREIGEDGRPFRRFHALKLLRDENPTFVLSWTLFHVIDKASPLFGKSEADLIETETIFTLSVRGADENAGQDVRANYSYEIADIRWGHRLVDILEQAETGEVMINYTRFHETEPV